MKDHIEIGHLTKFDAFRMNRDQATDLQTWPKIHTNVSYFESASPKTIYINSKFFYDFCDTLKNEQT